jgi:uncharacterized membrane protein YeaQ/YmgE (transglycosylase-associated protein family)
MQWVWLIIVGAVVGALGRFLLPGRDPMGWIATILIGVVSLIVAGLIFSGFWQYVIGVVVAVALVWIYGRVMSNRSSVATAP